MIRVRPVGRVRLVGRLRRVSHVKKSQESVTSVSTKKMARDASQAKKNFRLFFLDYHTMLRFILTSDVSSTGEHFLICGNYCLYLQKMAALIPLEFCD